MWTHNSRNSLPAQLSVNFSAAYNPGRPYYSVTSALASHVNMYTQALDILVRRDIMHSLYGSDADKLHIDLSVKPSVYNPILLSLNNNTGLDLRSTDISKPELTELEDLSLKSQYQPMRKGVVNMIRIQSDKAVAMPTDTRLQILAVSKDIIHSWSIPSAGIKIDCIPGYSSHRVALFTLSGIY